MCLHKLRDRPRQIGVLITNLFTDRELWSTDRGNFTDWGLFHQSVLQIGELLLAAHQSVNADRVPESQSAPNLCDLW